MPRYKPAPRMCGACGKDGATVLDHKRTGDSAVATYICVGCARREYPDLFPPPPQQLAMGGLGRRQTYRSNLGNVQYVPLDREAAS